MTMLAAVGCSERRAPNSDVLVSALSLPNGPSGVAGADPNAAPTTWASAGGGTVKQLLTGPVIGGVAPEGQAVADMSQFSAGGSTILTVQVRRVGLPDGTVLSVVLHFTPVGSITLAKGAGTLVADLGHFGVSRDPIQVKRGTTVVLSGAYFQ
jgi:hypothetical protein